MMDDRKIYLTKSGYNKLQRIKKILHDAKPLFAAKVNKAKAHGDLRENSEYDIATSEKAMLDEKISNINQKMANCYIIDINKIKETKIVYGAYIVYDFVDEETQKTVEDYLVLVSDEESDMDYKLLSIKSSMGCGLIGKRAGEEFNFGSKKCTIKNITYDAEKVEAIVSQSSNNEIESIERSIANDLLR